MAECLPIQRRFGRREESVLSDFLWQRHPRRPREAVPRPYRAEKGLRLQPKPAHVVRRRPVQGPRSLMDIVIDMYLEHVRPGRDEEDVAPSISVDVLV